MFRLTLPRAATAIAAGAGWLAVQAGSAQAQQVNQTNLVSDGFVTAKTIDPNLINPWGIAYAPGSPFWIANNNSGTSTLYDGAGNKKPLTVAIPQWNGTSGGSPTGTVFNGSGGFNVSAGGKTGSALFLFATEDGTIQGWAPSVNAGSTEIAVNNWNGNTGAVYKGLASGSVGGSNFIYAANFRGGDVEMYNSAFGLTSTFTDPKVAAGYAPFNVQNLGGTLYVTYALQNGAKHDDVAGAGHGYVDAFSLDGHFERRIASLGGQINSPWGLVIAPKSFGALGGDLLVGNFGDGTISAFDPTNGDFEGKVLGKTGSPLVIGDLWALTVGGGGASGDPNAVYFTAGVMDEAHGLFGVLSVPEPETWSLMIVGLGLMGVALRGRRTLATSAIA